MLDGCHLLRRTMVGMPVQVVEDHATLAERIGEGLRNAGMAVAAPEPEHRPETTAAGAAPD